MMSTKTKRCYSELEAIRSFKERYEYLRLGGQVGDITFGYDRYLNQKFYKSYRWLQVRDLVIIRDYGCDLGVQGYQIGGKIIIHHLNPISLNDILAGTPEALDPEYLICVSTNTHLAIHYGDTSLLPKLPIVRSPGDTVLWLR